MDLDGPQVNGALMTPDEAGRDLGLTLTKWCGRDRYYFVGIGEDDMARPVLYIYARTLKQANELTAFVGHAHGGYPVRAKSLGGKVRPVYGLGG